MKVLLLGEFSALHRDLCDGLLALGHDARVASTGDGWKAIPTDIMLGSNAPGLKGRLARLWNPLASLPKLINHDVIQFISPVLFSTQFGDGLKKQVQHSAKVSPWTHTTTNFAQKNAPASCR